jgi:hypothetical protein
MSKRINVRLPDDLYSELHNKNGSMTDIICTALRTQFNNQNMIDVQCTDEDDSKLNMQNELYSNMYNMEVLPLKKEIEHKIEIIKILEKDKEYLQGQNNALLISKIPLLTKLKMKLIEKKDRNEE